MSERRVLVNENSLIAIGAAIREKNGTNNSYKPGEMAAAVLEIETGITPEGSYEITENGEYDITTYATAVVNVAGSGGGEDIEIPVFKGTMSYAFSYDKWNWAIKLYGDKMRTENITGCDNMFYYSSGLGKIPFDINLKPSTSSSGYHSMSSMFYYCSGLKEIPAINNAYPSDIGDMFAYCYKLRYLPEDLGDNWKWDRIHTYGYAYADSVFRDCWSLRKIPDNFLKNFYNSYTSSTGNMYNYTFFKCHNLDEVCGLQVSPATLTSNCCTYTFDYCYCLKKITFATNEDGTPKTANWKSQTINLSLIGYEDAEYLANNQYRDDWLFDSGRTVEKVIYNDETFALWKDDPDSYVCGFSKGSGGEPENPMAYSKYNRISAIETINSLPDTSAYGTNTIKFKGAAGSKTDGGAINTMTEEEIAVAAAKGWTVSFV